ncbi:MAG: hypothetical protein KF768_12360 [Phycisphaeraceae bacterium]|nr:hypothetical protein [Phycisphaeraceae bacterium]
MNQYGMSMPGGQMQRTASMNVYTGLLALSVLALVAAVGYLYVQGSKIAPDGQPYKIQAMDDQGRVTNLSLKD